MIGTWLGVGSTDSDRVEGRQLLLLLENTGGGGATRQESVGGEEVVVGAQTYSAHSVTLTGKPY